MSGQATYCDWIAVDWGTSSLRAWAMRDDVVVGQAQSNRGMGTLERVDFEPALVDLIAPWLGQGRMLIVACGMVGARQGWVEAPYTAVPCKPLANHFARPEVMDQRLDVRVIPGIKQVEPADVMRGEETQIAGHLVRTPGFDGVICLPGTHTKWAQISAGEVVSFRTFMTGEMFALLSKQSVLRHTIGKGWDNDVFATSVGDALAKPESMAARFFNLRAEHLLSGVEGAPARARLSGLLIGAELAAARPYWLGQRVAVVGDADISDHYATALKLQGVDAETAEATPTTLAGLSAVYSQLKETTL